MEKVRYTFTLKFDLVQQPQYEGEDFPVVDKATALKAMQRMFCQGMDQMVDWGEPLSALDEEYYPLDTCMSIEVKDVALNN